MIYLLLIQDQVRSQECICDSAGSCCNYIDQLKMLMLMTYLFFIH